jgi:hypothetical protein
MSAVAVVRIDRDAEDRAWAESRFDAMTAEITTLWDIAQDIEANWVDGRNISRLYPEQTAALHMRARIEGLQAPVMDRPSMSLIYQRLLGARIQRLAPEQYRGLPPGMYEPFRVGVTTEDIERAFRRAEELGGISFRNMRVATGLVARMKPPYWQRVISAAMTGEHDLTPQTARNLIATLQHWLKDNPDAPTRR